MVTSNLNSCPLVPQDLSALLSSPDLERLLQSLSSQLPPPGWLEHSALQPESLLRSLLLFALLSRSSRSTCLILSLCGLTLSHVALLAKLSSASDFMADALDVLLEHAPSPPPLLGRRVVLLDATHTFCPDQMIRHHLALDLTSRRPLALKLTQGGSVGETMPFSPPTRVAVGGRPDLLDPQELLSCHRAGRRFPGASAPRRSLV